MEENEKKFPTVCDQAAINTLATALAGVWFAKDWIVQPLNPNYGIYTLDSSILFPTMGT
jgi:hypothetical protein